MLRKFVCWFIMFGLSFALQNVFADQGRAFFAINLGLTVCIIFALCATIIVMGISKGAEAEANGISFLIVVVMAVVLGITIFATWGATKLFNVDFFVAYQIMTFGQCLCSNNDKK